METWSEAQAAAYIRGLESVLRLLAEFPEMARMWEEFSPPVRIHQYRSHLIIYMQDAVALEVIRVVHGRADWVAFLVD